MKFHAFWNNERGATAGEYALVMAIFASGVGVASMMLGTSVHDGMASDASIYSSAEVNPTGAAPTSTVPGGETGTPGGGTGTPGGGNGGDQTDPPGNESDTSPGKGKDK